MKKLILMTAAAMFVLVSCQKEEIQVEKPEVTLFNKQDKPVMRTVYDADNDNIHCDAPEGDCLPEATIHGKKTLQVDDITNIASFLENNKKELASNISETVIDKVKKGTWTIEIKGSNEKGKKFIFFYDETGERKLVLPFVNK